MKKRVVSRCIMSPQKHVCSGTDEAMDINNPLASYFVTLRILYNWKDIARLFNKYTAYYC